MNQEFAENIKNHIREYLPLDYQDAKITLEKITKGNDRTLTRDDFIKMGKDEILPCHFHTLLCKNG